MRPRISMKGSARPYVHPSVCPAIRPSIGILEKPPKSAENRKKKVENTVAVF